MSNNKVIIGTQTLSYNEIHNFASLPFEKYKVKKVLSFNKIPFYLNLKFKGQPSFKYLNSFQDFGLNKCSMYHLYNAISLGSKPWVSTFETFLPRWGNVSHKKKGEGIDLLKGDACKKLIGFSKCSAEMQKFEILKSFPSAVDDIFPKIDFLYPSQPLNITDYSEKNLDEEKIVFTLIGADFFRKGGKEMLVVLDNLYKKGIRNWKFNIVSKMRYADFATKSTKEDHDFAFSIINKYPEHIVYHAALPNQQVLALLKNSHIGLLPTYADSFGYSVIEAQACGCPVISTNIRALPEINNNEIGWLIEMPRTEVGNAQIKTEKERNGYALLLTDQLEPIVLDILTNPEQIKIKGIRALEKVDQMHNPAKAAKTLEKLYDQILKDS